MFKILFKKYFSFLSIIYHYLFCKIQIYGTNKLKISKDILLWKSKFKCKGINNVIVLGKNVKLEKTRIKINGNNNKIDICENVKIYESCEILVEGDNCEITIGRRTTIGSAHIFCGESNTSIKIGKDCMLSRGIYMNTSDFHSIIDAESNLRINIPANILIDDNVWIGFNARINKGAIVGKNSIIATSSVVSGKTYPSNVILAGIPAKIVKEKVIWKREKLPY
ncbi:acyltransferase [Kaistella sp.]|uniref:acyltransferase n=1 Tax=Kaistella sp. TaxID=2782235 RepID=UPI003C47742E